MTSRIVLVLCSIATSISAQGATPSDKASSSSDIMSNIFEWANAVRPMDPVNSQSASISDTGLPPEPLLPDINSGFPLASDLGLPAEPALPVKDPAPKQGSILSGQALPPPVDKAAKQPSKPNEGVLNLSNDVLIKDTVHAIPNPNQGLPGQVPLFPHIAGTNQGSPKDVNLDAEIVDPNLLFPAETANKPKPNLNNNNFMINFLPLFPKGDKVVNLNTGETLNNPTDIGVLPDPNTVDSNVLGFPAENLPPKPDIPVTDPFVLEKMPRKPDLPVKDPFAPDTSMQANIGANQSPVDLPLNNQIPVEILPERPILPPGTVVESIPDNQFVPTEPQLQPFQSVGPVEPLSQKPHLPPGTTEELLPVAPSFPHPPALPGRPIAMLPIGTIDHRKKPQKLPLDKPAFGGVKLDNFGVPDTPIPSDAQLFTDITKPRRVNDVLPTADQGLTRSDPNIVPSKWFELYPDGRPAKLNNGSNLPFLSKMSL